MESIKENREMIKLLFNTEIGCTEEEFDTAFEMLVEDIEGNRLKETNLDYILNTLSTCLDVVRRLN